MNKQNSDVFDDSFGLQQQEISAVTKNIKVGKKIKQVKIETAKAEMHKNQSGAIDSKNSSFSSSALHGSFNDKNTSIMQALISSSMDQSQVRIIPPEELLFAHNIQNCDTRRSIQNRHQSSQVVLQNNGNMLLSSPTLSPNQSKFMQRGGLQPLQGKKIYMRNMTHKHNLQSAGIDHESQQSQRSGQIKPSYRHGQTVRSNLSGMHIIVAELNHNNENLSMPPSENGSHRSSSANNEFLRMNSSIQNVQRAIGHNSSYGSVPGSPGLMSSGSFRKSESHFKKQQSNVTFLKLQNTIKGDQKDLNTPLFQQFPIRETNKSSLSSEYIDGVHEDDREIPYYKKQLSNFQSYVTQRMKNRNSGVEEEKEEEDDEAMDITNNLFARRIDTQITIEKLEDRFSPGKVEKFTEQSDKGEFIEENKQFDTFDRTGTGTNTLKLSDSNVRDTPKPILVNAKSISSQKSNQAHVFTFDFMNQQLNTSQQQIQAPELCKNQSLQQSSAKTFGPILDAGQSQSKIKKKISKSGSMDIVEKFLQDQQVKVQVSSSYKGRNDKNMTDRTQNVDTLTVSVFGGKRRSQQQPNNNNQQVINSLTGSIRRSQTISDRKQKKNRKYTRQDRENLLVLEKIYDQILRPQASQSSQSSLFRSYENMRSFNSDIQKKRMQMQQFSRQSSSNFDKEAPPQNIINSMNLQIPQMKIEVSNHNQVQKQFSFNLEQKSHQQNNSNYNQNSNSQVDILSQEESHRVDTTSRKQENTSSSSSSSSSDNKKNKNDITIQIFSAADDFDKNNQISRYNSMNQAKLINSDEETMQILQQQALLHCNTIVEVPEEDQKSSIALSDKGSNSRKNIQFSRFIRKPTSRQGNKASNMSINFVSVDPNHPPKIYDLVPKKKLIQIFRRVSEEISQTHQLLDKHNQMILASTIERNGVSSHQKQSNITGTSETSSQMNGPVQVQSFSIYGTNIDKNHATSQSEQQQPQSYLSTPKQVYPDSEQKEQVTTPEVITASPKLSSLAMFIRQNTRAIIVDEDSSEKKTASSRLTSNPSVEVINQGFVRKNTKIYSGRGNGKKTLREIVQDQIKTAQVNGRARNRENSMIVETRCQSQVTSPYSQGRKLIRSVKMLAKSTDNLEKLPILAAEARMNNLKNILMQQFGDNLRFQDQSQSQLQTKRNRFKQRAAFTHSNTSLGESANDSSIRLNNPKYFESNANFQEQDTRVKIEFLHSDNINNNGEFSPCSYTTPHDQNNDLLFFKRTYTPTSSGATPEHSVKFGLRDFNPGDFTYELQNIVRAFNQSPKHRSYNPGGFRLNQQNRHLTQNEQGRRRNSQFPSNTPTHQISSLSSTIQKTIKSSFIRSQRKQSLPHHLLLRALISSGDNLELIQNHNNYLLADRDSPSEISQRQSQNREDNYLDTSTIKTKVSSQDQDQQQLNYNNIIQKLGGSFQRYFSLKVNTADLLPEARRNYKPETPADSSIINMRESDLSNQFQDDKTLESQKLEDSKKEDEDEEIKVPDDITIKNEQIQAPTIYLPTQKINQANVLNGLGVSFSNRLEKPFKRPEMRKQPSNLTKENLIMLESSKLNKQIEIPLENPKFSSRKKVSIPNIKSTKSITTISAISSKVNGKTCINQYLIIQPIGRGKFAKVVMCIDQNTQQQYAMKIMNKKKLKKIFVGKNKFAYDAVETEMAILKKLDHPNIVRLYEIIDDPKHDKLYLITDLIKNGTLQKLLSKKDLTDIQIRKFFRQIIHAIEYCHENAKIIHRDIKPENILLDENDNVKLSDFGVSFMMENAGDDSLSNSAGSYYYFSPEACIGASYKGRKSDIWACGITLYFMIFKKHPFVSNLLPDLFRKIQTQQIVYPFELDASLQDLLTQCLTKNPENRISIEKIKKHPWMTDNGADPMPELEKQEIEITDQDKQNAFSKTKFLAEVIMKKLNKIQYEKKQGLQQIRIEDLDQDSKN
ncbi:protein kinase domain containing protein [Stylonychia lemnae]|uniref:Protein kinase domain containing protein n=1 Tax=Stylonychia lemnae TaxID=5949 RepID=A0A078B2G6_STYLE|nr:protein kinase domain containing protein [Stylonychia lemnae]|eukprot:CDW87678.1 protein kinase domain containing protein [Stylonychia lemnae]